VGIVFQFGWAAVFKWIIHCANDQFMRLI